MPRQRPSRMPPLQAGTERDVRTPINDWCQENRQFGGPIAVVAIQEHNHVRGICRGQTCEARSIDSASLWVGMMTDTRIFLIDSQPQRHFGLDSNAAAIKHTVITIEKTIGRIKRYLQLTTVMAARQTANAQAVPRMSTKVSAGRP